MRMALPETFRTYTLVAENVVSATTAEVTLLEGKSVTCNDLRMLFFSLSLKSEENYIVLRV